MKIFFVKIVNVAFSGFQPLTIFVKNFLHGYFFRVLNTSLGLFCLRNYTVTTDFSSNTWLKWNLDIPNYSIFCWVILSELLQIVPYYQSFIVFCINLTKYGFKGSQQLHVLRAAWGCFKHNWENVNDLVYWKEILRVSLTRAVHSKFHFCRSCTYLCYCQFALDFLSDGWSYLTTTTAATLINFSIASLC